MARGYPLGSSKGGTKRLSSWRDHDEETSIQHSDGADAVLCLKRERERESITYSFDTNVLSGIKLGGKKTGKM